MVSVSDGSGASFTLATTRRPAVAPRSAAATADRKANSVVAMAAGRPEESEAVMPELRQQERSIGELFGQLTQDMTLLVRQEVQLARTEMTEKLSRLTSNLISVGAGGFVGYFGGLGFIGGLILGFIGLAHNS